MNKWGEEIKFVDSVVIEKDKALDTIRFGDRFDHDSSKIIESTLDKKIGMASSVVEGATNG